MAGSERISCRHSSAVEQKRLTWEDLDVIRSKSSTYFSHADLRADNNNSNDSFMSHSANGQGRSREKKESYCEAWSNFNKCSCVITEPSYKDHLLCQVRDKDHVKLHCPRRRFPIKASPDNWLSLVTLNIVTIVNYFSLFEVPNLAGRTVKVSTCLNLPKWCIIISRYLTGGKENGELPKNPLLKILFIFNMLQKCTKCKGRLSIKDTRG